VVFPTSRPSINLLWRRSAEAAPAVAAPAPTPVQQARIVAVSVFADQNGNGAADPGEGVAQLPVRISDVTTGALIDSLSTDANGSAAAALLVEGNLRVTVLPFGELLATRDADLRVVVVLRTGSTPLQRWP
jgi:hypothetical protein